MQSMSEDATRDSMALNAGRRFWFASGVLFTAVFVALWLVLINDDWIDLYFHIRQGERVAQGEIPYRDFRLLAWPGLPLLLGCWFKLAGMSMAGVHVLQALLGACSAVLAWWTARRVIAGPLQWLAPAGAMASYVLGNEGIGHIAFAVTFALGAVYAAVRADEDGHSRWWVLAGILAALSGACTQTVGAYLGLGLTLAALTGPAGTRLRCATCTVAGAAPVLAAMLAYVVLTGGWEEFHYANFVYPGERYTPFHAGVRWGGWLPPWSLLETVPPFWRPTWSMAFSILYAGTFLYFPFTLYGCVRWLLKRDQPRARRIICLAMLAFIAAVYPHGGAMRIARLTVGFWILFAFELNELLQRFRPVGALQAWALPRRAAWLGCALLLLVVPMQFAYRPQMVELDTCRGRVLVYPIAAKEYRILEREFKPGDEVFFLPERGPAAVLYELRNPTAYEILVPVIGSPRQLRQAVADLQARGYPPVVFITSRGYSRIEGIIEKFGPSKYLDEFYNNAMNDCLKTHYEIVLREDPVIIFKRKQAVSPSNDS